MGGPRIGVGIPGIGGPRMGGGGMGGGRRGGGRGAQMQQVKGTVRWESAQTILDALKTPLPEAFANHYVISVSGIPLRGGGRRQDDDNGDSSPAFREYARQSEGLYLARAQRKAHRAARSCESATRRDTICSAFPRRVWTSPPTTRR